MTSMIFATTPAPTGSPWGLPEHTYELGPGAWFVSTRSHGGIHLSPERIAAMPPAMRREDAWFEEDLDWAMVAIVFPDLFEHHQQAVAEPILKHWRPEAFAAYAEQASARASANGDS